MNVVGHKKRCSFERYTIVFFCVSIAATFHRSVSQFIRGCRLLVFKKEAGASILFKIVFTYSHQNPTEVDLDGACLAVAGGICLAYRWFS